MYHSKAVFFSALDFFVLVKYMPIHLPFFRNGSIIVLIFSFYNSIDNKIYRFILLTQQCDHEATLISVDGGGLIKWDTPIDWPNNRTLSKEAQIMLIYNQPRNNPSNEMGKATWVGSIGEVNSWISEEKNNERFYVTVVLLSLLSIIISFLAYKKTNKSMITGN